MLDNIVFDKGTTLVGIAGGVSPHMLQEKADRVITDFIDCVIHRRNQAGKYMEELYGVKYYPADRSQFDGEIGDVITGKTVGRESDDQIINVSGVGNVDRRSGGGQHHFPKSERKRYRRSSRSHQLIK